MTFALALAALLFCGCPSSTDGDSVTITDPNSKLAGKELKDGLNVIDDLPDGYKIGIVRNAGMKDEWVTIAPNGNTTKVTSDGSSSETRSLVGEKTVWKCTKVGGDTGWVCKCFAHCDF